MTFVALFVYMLSDVHCVIYLLFKSHSFIGHLLPYQMTLVHHLLAYQMMFIVSLTYHMILLGA